MQELRVNQGIPSHLLWLIILTTGFSIANLYYCQPLLGMIRLEMNVSEVQVNAISIVSQLGYALGLLFIVPLGDMIKRKPIILANFGIITLALLVIGSAHNIYIILIASLVTGLCSVTPQLFLPMVSQYSLAQDRGRNVGLVLSGLLTGILASRVISGFVGELWGWRSMYYLAAIIMAISFIILYHYFPTILPTFKGSYKNLMKSLVKIAKEEPSLRFASIKSGLAFGSFLSLWAMLAFKMALPPFYAGGTIVGLLGLCGVAGALTASTIGKYVDRIGIYRINFIGGFLILFGWGLLYFLQYHYFGIISGIIILDIGMQCIQLGNQTNMLSLRPEAVNRVNTIFMTTYFIGGTLGTTLSGFAWAYLQWTGIALIGATLVSASLLLNLYQWYNKK